MSDESAKGVNLYDLFPQSSRVLLTGTGKQFIEKLGLQTVRQVILGVLSGENIRTQTEPLTRQRIAQLSGALVTMFALGHQLSPNFSDRLSSLAIDQKNNKKYRSKSDSWLANWMLGLTDKSVQNVLGGNSENMEAYVIDFEKAVEQAAKRLEIDIGDMRMELGYAEAKNGRKVELRWRDIIRLTTAIGSQTLTIRGSDKSMYGKVFERLVLGSVLTLLGFQRVDLRTNSSSHGVFWLSDSSDSRESDATLILQPGRVARFDIGFIGPGNSEISKDKLSRYANVTQYKTNTYTSTTFIIVDRLPDTGKTREAATLIDAVIIQMSMQFWPRELAKKLGDKFGFRHELQSLPDNQVHNFLKQQLDSIPIQDFLNNVLITNEEQVGDEDE